MGILTYLNRVRRLNPESSSHSIAIFSILFTPRPSSSVACSSFTSSGPRYKKFGKMVEMVNTGAGLVGSGPFMPPGLAVIGDGGSSGVSGLLGVRGRGGRF